MLEQSDAGDEWGQWLGPELERDTRVIELEPVLDLLERCVEQIGTDGEGTPWPVAQETLDLLKAHNRLAPEGSTE